MRKKQLCNLKLQKDEKKIFHVSNSSCVFIIPQKGEHNKEDTV